MEYVKHHCPKKQYTPKPIKQKAKFPRKSAGIRNMKAEGFKISHHESSGPGRV